ncbi:hypothetical protein C5L18_000612 [Lactobacillus amylolyticus]|uniref:Cyclic nucleotide-binding domain protein n=2 Tax=Lactobacillus amylolyticus TaxID=83683 RepID=D4YRG6_9LACO|nr:cyclic nucleotide-binding domain protein [Lactobacillus amylolyticus DSM 11664]KRL19124.1 CRP FNR family transcriptional regulator [Lactobacillus amylolyticus DSM 11664]TDG63533.1 hypothetical protein C5L18_000612 [Lactobacillus amylolyticus]
MIFMQKHSPVACLSKAALFSDLPQNLKEKLATVSTHQQRFPKGSIIHQPADGKNGMIVIDRGKAKVYSLSSDGKETVLVILKKGDIEGQQNLFISSNNENFIEALDDTLVCSINRMDFQQLLEKTPDLAVKLLNNFGEKLVELQHNTVLRNTLDAKERIMSYLQDLSVKQGRSTVKLQMKKKDLASLLGTTPETFSRKLKELEQEKRIATAGKAITILN